jgi:L-fuconolactonase
VFTHVVQKPIQRLCDNTGESSHHRAEMEIIDAHQHFWSLQRGDYGWLTPELAPIYRDFLPDDLQPILTEHQISGTVLVQAAPTRAETDYMLSLADQTPFIRGVVGWEEFESPGAADAISTLAGNPRLVGLRPMIQDIPEIDWMLSTELTPAFEALIAADLCFDALTLPQHLPALLQLAARHPNMRMVVDHGSKPQIAVKAFDDWAQHMALIATETNAFCKLSGLVTEASADWKTSDLQPYVDHLLNTFGPSRLIWGSDWPVCTLASSYERWLSTTADLLQGLAAAERAAVMGGNAATAYLSRRPA